MDNKIKLITLLTLFGLLSCSKPDVIAEYNFSWAKCQNGTLKIYSDSTYTKNCNDTSQTGTWCFQSNKDSIIELKKDNNFNETLTVNEYYFIKNNIVHPLVPVKYEESFKWVMINKIGPEWEKVESPKGCPISKVGDRIHLISSTSSSLLDSLTFKGHSKIFIGFYFKENQPGVSKGSTEFLSKTFLVTATNKE